MAEAVSSKEPGRGGNQARSSRAVVIPLVLILGIVVPTALYLLCVRPPNRERYFVESHVRDLAVLSEQIEGALQARLDALRGASWRGENWREAVAQIDLEPVEWDRCKVAADGSTPGAGVLPASDKRARGTVSDGSADGRDRDAGLGLQVVLRAASQDVPSSAPTEWGSLPAGASESKTGATLYFSKDCGEVSSTLPRPPGRSRKRSTDETPPKQVKVCGTGRLAKIVEPLVAGTPVDGFEMFVADGAGRILLERGPTGVGVTQLGPGAAASTPTAGIADVKCPNAAQGLPAIDELNAASSVRNVIVSGGCYTLIAQPVRTPRLLPEVARNGSTATAVTADTSPSRGVQEQAPWVVAMLVPRPSLEGEARAFSFGSWTTIPLLLLIILLATPTLKLAFLGSRAPLTPGDVRRAFFFTLAGSGIAVVTVMGSLSHAWLEDRLDAQLASLSKEIRAYFADEVARANDAVDLFMAVRGSTRAVAVHAAIDKNTPDCRERRHHSRECRKRKCAVISLFTDPSLRCPPYVAEPRKRSLDELVASRVKRPPALCGPLPRTKTSEQSGTLKPCAQMCTRLWGDGALSPPAPGSASQVLECLGQIDPGLDMLVLADADGRQWEKWTTKPDVTSLIPIDDHPSFKDAKNQNMWTLDGGAEAVVHVQRSSNTAELIATLSRRLADADGRFLGVATAVVGMASLRTPVLPPGFGAAVVQSDGKVVVHSQRQRSLYENFFAESTEAEAIAAAVGSRRAEFVESDYHARMHRMYVHPIERSPWTLIVFRDTELPRTLRFDVIATWFLLYVLYLSVVAAAWLLVRALARTDGEWVWPDVERSTAYWVASATLIVLGVANAAVMMRGGDDGTDRFLVGVAGPFIAMAILVLALVPPRTENGVPAAQATSRHRLRRVAWTVVGLGALAAVPACLAWSPGGLVNLPIVLAAAVVQGAMASDAAGRLRVHPRPGAAVEPARARHWRGAYVTLGVAGIVVVGVLPSVAIYKDAFDLGLTAFVRHAQRGLALRLAERERRIRDDHRGTLHPDRVEARLQLLWDVPRPDVFADDALGADAEPIPPLSETPDARDTETSCGTGRWGDRCRLATRHVSGVVMASLPVYHPESGQLREMLFNRASDGQWDADARGVTVRDPRLITRPGGVRLQRAGGFPGWPVAPQSIPAGVLLLGAALALAGAYALTWWYANQLFDLRHAGEHETPDDGTWVRGQGVLLVHPSARLRQHLEVLGKTPAGTPDPTIARVDLQQPKPEQGWPVPNESRLTIVDHLEHNIDDGKHNRAKLEFLESLVLIPGARCIVLSTVDPLQHVRHRLQSPGDTADHRYVTVEEIDRWARVLDRLLKVALPLSGPPVAMEDRVLRHIHSLRDVSPVDAERRTRAQWQKSVVEAAHHAGTAAAGWIEALASECWWTPRLRGLAIEAATLYDPPAHPLARIRDMARPHHRTLWTTLTDQQKLVLIHLARYGFVNPRNWRVVSRLMEQGLVQRAPAVRLMSESFTEFVKRAESSRDVERWECAAGPSTWHSIRGVVIAASVLAAVVLSQSQPELLKYLAAALTAAAGFGVTVTTLLGLFHTRRGPAEPGTQ